ncbi:trypsin-3-like [Harmonia axyridis]|uniref:trypsin-3-like n=1 Tax=Harmonia axyridis TaxID=115357 RepID=UPI001E278424|nr:trypsin-3-like [Harmonia axyridis]
MNREHALQILLNLQVQMTALLCIALILLNLTSSFAIYNGESCDPRNYTFLVQLVGHRKNNSTVKCSGTLIRLDTVLTAAHCVLNFKRSIFAEPKVVLHTEKGKVAVGTKEIHIHAKYDKENLQYDVAILRLEEAFASSEASTITLPKTHSPKNLERCSKGRFLGWGRTKFLGIGQTSEPSKESLHCIELPVISNEDCSILRSLDKIETFFCTFSGFHTAGGGCIGDSGGPFICEGVQYGIASVNFGCGIRGEPTYFTRIDKAFGFIDRHVRSYAVSGMTNGVTGFVVYSLIFIHCNWSFQ